MQRGQSIAPTPPRVAALLALLLLWAQPGAPSAGVVRFAPIPMEDRGIVREQFHGLVDYLEENTGLQLRWVQLGDNQAVVEAFRAGAVDLAYLGPLPHLRVHEQPSSARTLGCVRDEDGQAGYTCALVVRGDDGLTPDRLRGLHFGLTGPASTCGYLGVSRMLGSAGTGLHEHGNRFSYAGNHTAAILGLARGDFDAVGVKTTIARRYAHLNLDIVATSETYPGFTLVANAATLEPQTLSALAAAVAALDPRQSPALAARMSQWPAQLRHGVLPPEACDHTPVRRALDALPGPIPDGR